MEGPACTWCETPFTPDPKQPRKRFCSTGHRMAFHNALRLWAEREFADARVTLDQLRDAAL